MSHKTLYIDIDEEITSIVDRVRKAQAAEIIVVAPKRALLLQSLVNLKLLKKEADRRKKRVMIVTQDRVGKKLIEKAGILVQGKMDDSLNEDPDEESFISAETRTRPDADIEEEIGNGDNLAEIGSDAYFDEPVKQVETPPNNIGEVTFEEKKEKEKEIPAPKEKPSAPKSKRTKGVRISDIVAGPKSQAKRASGKSVKIPNKSVGGKKEKASSYFEKNGIGQKMEVKAEEYFGKIPSPSVMTPRKEKNLIKTERVKGKAGRYFAVFAAIFVILAVLAGAYFVLPKAQLTIYLSDQEKGVSESIEAATSANGIEISNKRIPAAVEQIEKEVTREFDATGSKGGAGTASGKVVIYNEFSSEDQPLVATTRLETDDGKIFRITKNIVVPGMSKVGTETNPGAIEVDVAADKPGNDYNIEPATFKIPGFQGGPKYDKFYAKSMKSMTGGSEGEAAAVSVQDIADAKEKTMVAAQKEAVQELSASLPSGRKIFEDTIVAEVQNAAPSVNAGAQAEKFSYTVKIKAKTFSFSENDAKEILKSSVSDDGSGNLIFNKPLNYILSEEKIDEGYVKFEAKTDLSFLSDVDVANFKKGILGKDSEQVQALVKSYSGIKKADVTFWPFFVKRVPLNEKRVSVEIR